LVVWSSGNTNVAVVTFSLGLVIAALSSIRIRRAHFSWTSTLLALAGLPIFSYLLFRSAALHRNHAVQWKGRTYGHLGDVGPRKDRPRASPAHK
jgi:cyanate permease